MKIKILFPCLILICFLWIGNSNGQNLEVEGKAKVTDLTKDNTASSVVVVVGDGNLGTRDASSLGGLSPFIVGGGSAFNGSDKDDNFVPMGSSLRTEFYLDSRTRVPMAGTLTKFEGAITNITSTTNYVFTVYKNGVATGLTCTVSQNSTSCTELNTCISFSDGEYISILFKGDDDADMSSDNRPGRWAAIFTPGATCP